MIDLQEYESCSRFPPPEDAELKESINGRWTDLLYLSNSGNWVYVGTKPTQGTES